MQPSLNITLKRVDDFRKSSIKPPLHLSSKPLLSNKPPFSWEEHLISPLPLPHYYYSLMIAVSIYHDCKTSRGLINRSFDLFLIPGCMISNFLYLSLASFYASSLWRTADTVVFAKSNKPPSPVSLPSLLTPPPHSNVFELNTPPPRGGVIED